MMREEEHALAVAAQQGIPEALAQLAVRFARPARAIARRWGREADRPDLESVAQVAMLEALPKWDPDHGGAFISYAFRAACWAAMDAAFAMRSPVSRNAWQLRSIRTGQMGPEALPFEEESAELIGESPEDALLDAIDGRMQQAALPALLSTLDPSDRELLRMRVENGATLKEVGKDLGVSQATVLRRQRKALAHLQSRVRMRSAAGATRVSLFDAARGRRAPNGREGGGGVPHHTKTPDTGGLEL